MNSTSPTLLSGYNRTIPDAIPGRLIESLRVGREAKTLKQLLEKPSWPIVTT